MDQGAGRGALYIRVVKEDESGGKVTPLHLFPPLIARSGPDRPTKG